MSSMAPAGGPVTANVGVPDVPQCSGNSAYNVDASGKPAFPLTK